VRRLALLLAGAALLGAVLLGARLLGVWPGGEHPDRAFSRVRTGPDSRPVPHRPVRRPAPHAEAVLVTVVDGDTNRRVRGARVRIGRRVAVTGKNGVASVPLGRRGAFVTSVQKGGYDGRAIRLSFRTRPRSTVRMYASAQQWRMYGAVAARTQAQTAIRIRPPFRVVWSRGLGGLIEFPAVVSDGVAYIGNDRETIRALDLRDGSVLWRHDIRGGKMASSPAVWRDALVVHGMDGVVRVLRRADGRELWRWNAGSPIESSPAVRRGIDVFGTWSGRIVALDLRRRRVVWSRYDGCKITSSPAVSRRLLALGDYCGRLVVLDARSGQLRWTRSVNGRVYGTPAIAGGRIFVPSPTGGSLTAFSTTGRYLWRHQFGAYVYSSPAASTGRVFVGDYAGRLTALSAATGAVRWSVPTGGAVSGAAVVVDGVAYAGSFSHRIVGADVRTGKVLVTFPHGEYVPVSGAGTRLLLHGYSRIYAVVRR